MDAKSELHSWCNKRGLNLNFQTRRTDHSTYRSQVKVDSFDFLGIGEASTKKLAEKNASQDFLQRLKETGNFQDHASGANVIWSKHQVSSKGQANLAIADAKSFLCHWCRKNGATDSYDYSFSGDPHSRIFICSIVLKSSSGSILYGGKAQASSKKDANHLAAKKAVKYLITKELVEPHEVKHIDLSVTEDETGIHSAYHPTKRTPYNVRSITNVDKSVNTYPLKNLSLPKDKTGILSLYHSKKRSPYNVRSITNAGNPVNTSPLTNLSLPEDETGIQTVYYSPTRTPYNVHSISNVGKPVNTTPLTMDSLTLSSSGNWNIDNATRRLHQFLKENNIDADFNYTTDCYNLEGYHVADMKIHVMWVGKLFKGIGNASTRDEATKKCALSLVKQLYRANLIEAYEGILKKDESIFTSNKPIDLYVPDDDVDNIRELCAEFEEKVPQLVSSRSGTGPILLSSLQSDSEDFSSIEDIVQPRYGIARMNWNPWTSTAIQVNECNHNVSLRDLSKNMKSAYEEKSSSVTFKAIQWGRQSLPIFQFKEDILNCIDDNSVTIVKGSTGCGKSTQVCQYILDEAIENNIGSHYNVVVIEPHRICATSLAAYVARERCEPLGRSVGYSVRFHSCFPQSHGAILFCTADSFIRKLENGLTGISHIIVDEIHARNLETDYILTILRNMLVNNLTLKVILLSANIDIDLFASYFGGCPHVSVVAQTHPVQEYFLEDCIKLINFKVGDSQLQSNFELDSDDEVLCSFENSAEDTNISESPLFFSDKLKTVAVVEKQQICFEFIEAIILWFRKQRIEGSILVFLPEWSEIRVALQYLQKSKFSDDFCFLTLHSKQNNEELMKVFMPVRNGMTKVILSTSLAESAVSINDDIVCVIDSCKTSILRSQNNSGSKLVTEWASKVNLDQRLARAGHKKPGYCFRLCTRSKYENLSENLEPEIFRMPLYNVALSIKHLKLGSLKELLNNAITPPKPEAIKEAERLLIDLKCLDNYKELTTLGNVLARLPLDLRLGRMVLLSTIFNCTDQILKLVASIQDEFFMENPTRDMSYVANERFSDHLAVLYALSVKKQANDPESSQMSSDSRINTFKVEKQLYSILERIGFDLTEMYGSGNKKFDLVSALLCQGFYPDVCARDNKRKIYFSDGKFGLVSRKTLMNIKDRNFNPPSPIFVYGERTETQVNVCRNLSMVLPIHLLCFTNCKVAIEGGGMVKIDDWLTLRMDPNIAALLMSVRSMIDNALLEVAGDPTLLDKPKFRKLKNAVRRLCISDLGKEATFGSSSHDPQRNFFQRPTPRGRGRMFDLPKNQNNGCLWIKDRPKDSGFGRGRGRGRGKGNYRDNY